MEKCPNCINKPMYYCDRYKKVKGKLYCIPYDCYVYEINYKCDVIENGRC